MTLPHTTKKETVKHFHLNRIIDESGMSGLGKIAEGVELPNGVAVMWWLVPPNSVQIYKSIDDLHHIHKHGKKNTTELVYDASELLALLDRVEGEIGEDEKYDKEGPLERVGGEILKGTINGMNIERRRIRDIINHKKKEI